MQTSCSCVMNVVSGGFYIYSCNKLTDGEREKIQGSLSDVSFTCGAPIEDFDADLPVYTRSLNCYEPIEKQYYSAGYEPIEKQYYSAGYEPICVYCASTDKLKTNTGYLPQCTDCAGKEEIKK